MIVNKTCVGYKKHLKHSYGTYGQASMYNKPRSNDNRGRTIDAIYLRPSPSLQGGHDVMELATGIVLTRPKWTPCRITNMVVKRVEDLAKEQGLSSCKFYNRKRQPTVMRPIDLQLQGVDGIEDLEVVEHDEVYPEAELPSEEANESDDEI